MERILKEEEYQELAEKANSNVSFTYIYDMNNDFSFEEIHYKNFTNEEIIDKIEALNCKLNYYIDNVSALVTIQKDYNKIPKWIRNLWK